MRKIASILFFQMVTPIFDTKFELFESNVLQIERSLCTFSQIFRELEDIEI